MAVPSKRVLRVPGEDPVEIVGDQQEATKPRKKKWKRQSENFHKSNGMSQRWVQQYHNKFWLDVGWNADDFERLSSICLAKGIQFISLPFWASSSAHSHMKQTRLSHVCYTIWRPNINTGKSSLCSLTTSWRETESSWHLNLLTSHTSIHGNVNEFAESTKIISKSIAKVKHSLPQQLLFN